MPTHDRVDCARPLTFAFVLGGGLRSGARDRGDKASVVGIAQPKRRQRSPALVGATGLPLRWGARARRRPPRSSAPRPFHKPGADLAACPRCSRSRRTAVSSSCPIEQTLTSRCVCSFTVTTDARANPAAPPSPTRAVALARANAELSEIVRSRQRGRIRSVLVQPLREQQSQCRRRGRYRDGSEAVALARLVDLTKRQGRWRVTARCEELVQGWGPLSTTTRGLSERAKSCRSQEAGCLAAGRALRLGRAGSREGDCVASTTWTARLLRSALADRAGRPVPSGVGGPVDDQGSGRRLTVLSPARCTDQQARA